MPLIKNPEFKPNETRSHDLRIGRVIFGTKIPILDIGTRQAIFSSIASSMTDEVQAVAVDLKRRPIEILTFEVVSEFPDRDVAAIFSLGLPMQAIRHAGVDFDRLVHLRHPTLVSNDRDEDPLKHHIGSELYDNLRALVGGVAIDRGGLTPPTPLFAPMLAEASAATPASLARAA